ncbi:hypothetical protein DFQ10_101247 [Winogradskyella eximia]|uniref:Lipoprotein n=1 Tax=Winogradskyella eximia TaxID=262006 RepID=A0A3D9HAG6_9FLAO|nr:hypothetical protein [Winogradskyella eximia]RED46477.1 hypothetical protein DFQ10_101247 [Winogradskyella eximia]
MNFKTIKKILFFFCFCIVLSSCKKKNKTVTANLSFRSISFTSAYGAKENLYREILNGADSIVSSFNKEAKNNGRTNTENQNYLLSKHVLKLDELEMLKLPHIYLHFGADSIMEVYLSENEYKKIKHFRQVDLFKEKKKVILELDIKEIDSGIYYSDNIRSVKKADGKSRSNIFKQE